MMQGETKSNAAGLVELGVASAETQGAGGPYPEGISTMLHSGMSDD